MRKRLLLITGSLLFTLFVTLIFASKRPAHKHNTKHAGIDLSVTVYKKSDYSTAQYNRESAQLHVKVSTDENVVISDTTFSSEYVHQYPSLKDAVQQTLEIKD